MSLLLESVKKEILSWPYVTAEPYRFGGIELTIQLTKGKWDIYMVND
jgi:hypothetical protein